jgi:hypothetical protein
MSLTPVHVNYHSHMMNLEGLPNWSVELKEVSAGVYKATAVHTLGPRIERTGTDEEKLIAEIKASATRMELEIEKKSQSECPGQVNERNRLFATIDRQNGTAG